MKPPQSKVQALQGAWADENEMNEIYERIQVSLGVYVGKSGDKEGLTQVVRLDFRAQTDLDTLLNIIHEVLESLPQRESKYVKDSKGALETIRSSLLEILSQSTPCQSSLNITWDSLNSITQGFKELLEAGIPHYDAAEEAERQEHLPLFDNIKRIVKLLRNGLSQAGDGNEVD